MDIAAVAAGKLAGKGFYDYETKPRRLWSGLRAFVEVRPAATSFEYIQSRMMLVQGLEAAKCLEEGILRSKRDAEIGAIFGVGFAPNTGGPLAYLDRVGLKDVVSKLDALAAELGPRYAPNQLLRDMAANGERFFEAA